jgi:hypothetical protein
MLINEGGAKSVFINIRPWKDASDYNVNCADRQHEITIMSDVAVEIYA